MKYSTVPTAAERAPEVPMPQPAPSKLLLDVNEAAAMLGCGKTTFYQLLTQGEIPLIKIGRLTRIPVTELTEYVNRKVRESAWAVTL